MAHVLTGLVALLPRLARLADGHALNAPFALKNGFAFLPLDKQNLAAFVGVDQGASLGQFRYLTQALVDRLTPLSGDGAFAYIETEYFGGDGGQGAVTFSERRVISGPEYERNAINRALALLGVKTSPLSDAFDTIGLATIRSNGDARPRV